MVTDRMRSCGCRSSHGVPGGAIQLFGTGDGQVPVGNTLRPATSLRFPAAIPGVFGIVEQVGGQSLYHDQDAGTEPFVHISDAR